MIKNYILRILYFKGFPQLFFFFFFRKALRFSTFFGSNSKLGFLFVGNISCFSEECFLFYIYRDVQRTKLRSTLGFIYLFFNLEDKEKFYSPSLFICVLLRAKYISYLWPYVLKKKNLKFEILNFIRTGHKVSKIKLSNLTKIFDNLVFCN